MKGTVICQLWPLPYKLFNEQLSVWVSDNWCLHHETDINMKAPVRWRFYNLFYIWFYNGSIPVIEH